MNVAKMTDKLIADIVSVINKSSLPITLKKYVIADIYRELLQEHNKELSKEESDEQSI